MLARCSPALERLFFLRADSHFEICVRHFAGKLRHSVPMTNPNSDPAGDPPPKPFARFVGKTFSHIRNTLITGVVAIIPLYVTYIVMEFAYNIITGVSAS